MCRPVRLFSLLQYVCLRGHRRSSMLRSHAARVGRRLVFADCSARPPFSQCSSFSAMLLGARSDRPNDRSGFSTTAVFPHSCDGHGTGAGRPAVNTRLTNQRSVQDLRSMQPITSVARSVHPSPLLVVAELPARHWPRLLSWRSCCCRHETKMGRTALSACLPEISSLAQPHCKWGGPRRICVHC